MAKSPVSILFGKDSATTYVEVPIRSGIAVPSGQPGFIVLGSDGTNTRYLSVDATGKIAIQNFPSAQAVTQSGTWTVQQGTPPWSVSQSGIWNITDITGTVSLPTGAATETTLTGVLTTSAFQTRVPVNGQAVMASSIPVVIASNQSSIAINDNAGSITVDSPQLPAALVGGRLDANVGAWLGSTTPTVGQKTMAASVPVVISSDQTTIAVSTAPASASLAGFARGDVTTVSIVLTPVRRTVYTEQTSDAQRSIVSTSANDTSAGTGARTVKIVYLDSTGAGPFTETVTLNGTTAVNTVASDICFIEKLEVMTAGSGGSNAGTINLKAATGGGGATVWSIGIGDNETFGCHHYIPTGKTAHITAQWGGHTGTTTGSGATFTIRSLQIGVANVVEKVISDSFRLYGQSSSVQRNYGSAIVVAGPARLLTYVLPETGTTINYRASFDLYED